MILQCWLQASRGEFSDDEKQGQKEITLKEDVEPATRAALYKQYLMYTMSGDVVELPVGGAVRKKNSGSSRQADMGRLSQLGDILGMSQVRDVCDGVTLLFCILVCGACCVGEASSS